MAQHTSPPSPALRGRVETLYAHAKRGEWPDVWRALAGERALAAACVVHASTTSGWTFLHQAAYTGDEASARTLVRLGASVAAISKSGETAWHVAVDRGHAALAEVLAAAERGTGMLWEAPSRADAYPSSCAWDEAREQCAWRELRIAYGGSVVVIPLGSRYYVDAFDRALIGWHGTYDPPTGMDGEPLVLSWGAKPRADRSGWKPLPCPGTLPSVKRLYKKLVLHEASHLHLEPGHERTLASDAEIAEAERTLGVTLPKTYRQFCREVGGASWPREIYSASVLALYPPDLERPAYLLAFATDGSGNDSCFDTRVATNREYPIVFWDHEEPPDAASLATPGDAVPFDTWLLEEIDDALDDDGGGEASPWEERFERVEAALAAHRLSGTWPWAPSEEQITEVAAEVGVTLPRDYVRFTTTLGSTPWPLEIVDATEIARLTEEMRREHGTPRGKAVAFGRDRDGSYMVFRPRGKLACVGGTAVDDASFLAFLERRIDEANEGSSALERQSTSTVVAEPVPSLPSRISADERTNTLWRAVISARAYEAKTLPDGRLQLAIDKGADGRVRMFVEPAQWAPVQDELARWGR